MIEVPGGYGTSAEVAVVDPALSVREQSAVADLLEGYPDLVAARGLEPVSGLGHGFLGKAVAVAAAGGVVTALVAWAKSTSVSAPRPGSITEEVTRILDWVQTIGSTALIGGAGVALLLGVLRYIDTRNLRAVTRLAREHAVRSDTLAAPAARLLKRAQAAAAAIRESRMHSTDLAGLRHRTEEHLPAELWEIARTLREYSSLAQSNSGGEGEDRVADLRKSERSALATVLTSTERRVEALELYARRCAEADRRYEALAAVEELEARGERVMELLARTAADDVAAEDSRRLADQAAAAGEALSEALDQAKDAAVIALPERDSA
ncbi:hypothetical protein [Streptacidiphilus jiangxiensis]|uniref:Uncharacterized protein n=1 Tax=Streptacidiphilus jiangxiensis TaxID=235985 RepID=A0A1H8BBP4_STRJI|nr:hypothetical protein [Streptacidiphilus jiangxiensis]SEM80242.1 hypothetical protein SAMN05414137_1611 [Streptacidiphilus jiangxiensis]